MNTIRFWIQNARYRALPQSVLPAVLACCMAIGKDGFAWWSGILAVAGVMAGHLGLNLFDDYFDYRIKGAAYRDALARKGFRARMAKCAYITSGKADLKQLLTASCVFCGLALCCGTAIFLFRGVPILWYALAAALAGISYSGWPIRFSYHGMGEALIGVMFGPLLMMGVYFSACGTLDLSVIFVSIPVGLLVANIVYTHSIMDYEPDREAGKKTFAVLLGNKTRMLTCLFLLLLTAYASIAYGVYAGYLSHYYLFTLLTLPMAAGLFYLMVIFVRCPERKFTPQPWMGPMGNWKRFEAANLDWFMIRWLLARNLLSFFCLIIIIVCFIH